MSDSVRNLLISVAISLGTGFLSGILSSGSRQIYENMERPPFSPPGVVFPIVWTILYILMGIAAYLIWSKKDALGRKEALRIYGIQLFLNFLWAPVFFKLGQPTLAFVILVLLWITIFVMIGAFQKIDKKAAWLLVPYLLWVSFAGYLNLAIVIFME